MFQDLASLVRGIYEAMGSSLKLSPSGSKTIRVRLTIAPDRKTADGVKLTKKTKKKKGRKRPEGSENEAKRDFEDDKEHDGQNRGEEEDEEKRTIPGMESEDEDREGDDEEDEDEDEEGGEDDEDKELCPAPAVTEYSKAAEVTTLAGGGRRSHHHHHHHHQQRQESRHLSNPLPVKSALDSQYSHRSPNWIAEEKTQKSPQLGTSPSLGRKRNRVSFSSPSKLLQKTQLLEIIQANLEKNSFGNYVETSK